MKVEVYQCRPIYHPLPVVAWLIMLFQGMKPWKKDSFSHMAMSINGKFYDVTGSGAKIHSSDQFLKRYKLIRVHEIKNENNPVEFNSWFMRFKHVEYDHMQIVGLLLKGLGFFTFNKLGYDFKKLICNELIIAYLAEFEGLKFKDSDNFDLINTWCKVKEY